MSNQPFYHLRPNKFVDRELFVEVLKRLIRPKELPDYCYCGFGSYYFDDFRALHSKLNIHNMVSIERDDLAYCRAEFNRPLNCINVIHQDSTDFIASFDPEEDKHYIFWLDYASPKEIAEQFRDYCDLISKLRSGDIIRITLNANITALGYEKDTMLMEERRQRRLEELRFRLAGFVPMQCTLDDMTTSGYPVVLLSCLQNATLETLATNPYRKEFLMPLYATLYSDGQKMLTFTGIILDDPVEQSAARIDLEGLTYCACEWDKISSIQIPALTQKEVTAINEKLPISDSIDQLDKIHQEFAYVFEKKEELKSYITYYRCYPNFHHVGS